MEAVGLVVVCRVDLIELSCLRTFFSNTSTSKFCLSERQHFIIRFVFFFFACLSFFSGH